MSGHISPKSTYYAIFGALMVLTAVTVGVAFINLGALNFPVAIAIAITKATLVILFFMHVKYSSQLTKMFVGHGVLLPVDHVRADDDRLPVARLERRTRGGCGRRRLRRAPSAGTAGSPRSAPAGTGRREGH